MRPLRRIIKFRPSLVWLATFATIVVSLPPAGVAAQTEESPWVGRRVRFVAPFRVQAAEVESGRVDGHVERIDADSIAIRQLQHRTSPFRGELLVSARADIDQMEVGRERSNALRGLGIGAAVGAVAGTVTFLAACDGLQFGFGPPPSKAGCALGGAMLGLIPGVVIGLVVGIATSSTRWSPADLPFQTHITLAPNPVGSWQPAVTIRVRL